MPAVSRAQQIAAAIAKHQPEKLYARNRGLLEMDLSDLAHLAQTKHGKLPKHAKRRKA